MFILALTGGVACGKSTVCKGLLDHLSQLRPSYFSCDESVGELLTDGLILGKLAEIAGDQIIDSNGALNREWFRNALFHDPALRKKVEDILHPKVLIRAKHFIGELNGSNSLIVIEIPLLYEVDFPIDSDMILVVGASEKTQIQRLTEKRNIDHETALGILGAQFPVREKIARADRVIWNDGQQSLLDRQIELFARQLGRNFN